MSRTYRTLLVAVVALLAVGGYWKLLLSPKRAQATELSTQVATKQAELEKVHPAAKQINKQTAVQTGPVPLHPGAKQALGG